MTVTARTLGHRGDGVSAAEACPACGESGRKVKRVTLESLLRPERRGEIGEDQYHVCVTPHCDTVYFSDGSGRRYGRSDLTVRFGLKEAHPPHHVCYCFDHTVEEIQDEVRRTGQCTVVERIKVDMKGPGCRCEYTNPLGGCCLKSVQAAVTNAFRLIGDEERAAAVGAAEHGDCCADNGRSSKEPKVMSDGCAMNTKTESKAAPRLDAGIIAQIGALASAVVASACCWLPLLLIAVGVSGGALAATFEAWRPVLLPVTFVLLGVAFYFTYRRPRVAGSAGTDSGPSGNDCCGVPEAGSVEACCPPENAGGMTLKKVNKAMLWVVTAFVLAFAFFPNYVGYLLGGSDTLAMRNDLDKVVVEIEGMTCEACAASIEDSLRKVPGVAAAEVSYEKRQAVVGLPRSSEPPREAILSAVAAAGNYTGSFADQVEWSLSIEGMTCEGCASGLQAALSKVPGVTGASVSYEEKRALVTTTPPVSEEVLRKAISEAGYSVKSAARE